MKAVGRIAPASADELEAHRQLRAGAGLAAGTDGERGGEAGDQREPEAGAGAVGAGPDAAAGVANVDAQVAVGPVDLEFDVAGVRLVAT
jgi:hypothetical protein